MRGDLESPLYRFWKWWSSEILYFIPSRIRKALDHKERILLVSVHERDMHVALLQGDEREQIESIRFRNLSAVELDAGQSEPDLALPDVDAVVVELHAAQTAQRRVSLPFGTEERIAEVLGYEMDRLTPYAMDDVYFHYRVAGRDADRRVIDIELAISLRRTVDDVLGRLKQRGINPSKVTLKGAHGSADQSLATVNFLPRDQRAKFASRRTYLPSTLTVLAALLAITAIAYPLVHQNLQLKHLNDEISKLGPAAIAAEQIRDEISEAVRQGGFFAEKWTSMPTKIRLLNELTRIVPDDTWLSRVQILGTTVRVHGESEGASSLIGLIEASELLSDVRFSSPVTKNPRTENDRFVIEARIETGNSGS